MVNLLTERGAALTREAEIIKQVEEIRKSWVQTAKGSDNTMRDYTDSVIYGITLALTTIQNYLKAKAIHRQVIDCAPADAFHCLRCRWDWSPRGAARPKVCPRCKSYRWDQKR